MIVSLGIILALSLWIIINTITRKYKDELFALLPIILLTVLTMVLIVMASQQKAELDELRNECPQYEIVEEVLWRKVQ